MEIAGIIGAGAGMAAWIIAGIAWSFKDAIWTAEMETAFMATMGIKG